MQRDEGDEGNLLATVNAAVRFSAYDPISVINPLTGQPMTIFTLRNEFRGLPGQAVLTNPGERPGDTIKLERQYNGFEPRLIRVMKTRDAIHHQTQSHHAPGTWHRAPGTSIFAAYV